MRSGDNQWWKELHHLETCAYEVIQFEDVSGSVEKIVSSTIFESKETMKSGSEEIIAVDDICEQGIDDRWSFGWEAWFLAIVCDHDLIGITIP